MIQIGHLSWQFIIISSVSEGPDGISGYSKLNFHNLCEVLENMKIENLTTDFAFPIAYGQ